MTLIKVFVPHVPAMLVFGGYSSGVIAAVAVDLPVMGLILYTALREDWGSGAKAVRYGLLVPAAIGGGILVLFRI